VGSDPADAGADTRGRGFDLIANRALVFLALTACGVITYALLVSVLGTAVPARGANAVLVGSALAAVLLLTRDWMQRGVDWLLYGDRQDPQRAILRVGRHVESAPDPAGLLPALARTVAAALRLSYLEVEIADPATVVRIGEPTTRTTAQPLLHSGSQVGELRAGRRGEQLSRRAELPPPSRQESVMIHRHPGRVFGVLVLIAIVCLALGYPGRNGDISGPLMVISGLGWIGFPLTALATVVLAVYLALARARGRRADLDA
jgi:hypothetical protein